MPVAALPPMRPFIRIFQNEGMPAGRVQTASNLYEGKREMEFLSEFWLYMRSRKKFFLLPIVVMLGLFAGLVILTKGTAIAPFIYTLF
jgi:hypothetical protein